MATDLTWSFASSFRIILQGSQSLYVFLVGAFSERRNEKKTVKGMH